MENSVEICSIDTTPEGDDFSTSYSSLWINPSTCRCGVEQKYPSDAMSMDEYVGNVLTYDIDNLRGYQGDYRVNAEKLEEYLLSEPAQVLLSRICDGWSSEWDDENECGRLDDGGKAAVKELLEDISGLESKAQTVVDVIDWLDSLSGSKISALTLDDDLADLTDEIEKDATEQGVVINGSVYDLLAKWRDEEVEEWKDRARDEMSNGWDDDVPISHCILETKSLEIQFDFPDGKRGIVRVSEDEVQVISDPFQA